MFRAGRFDDAEPVAPNVHTASERMYDTEVELGLFPPFVQARATPTPFPTPENPTLEDLQRELSKNSRTWQCRGPKHSRFEFHPASMDAIFC